MRLIINIDPIIQLINTFKVVERKDFVDMK